MTPQPTPRWVVISAWIAATAVLSAAAYSAVHAAQEGSDAHLRWQETRYVLRGVDPIDVATGIVPPVDDIGPLTELAGYPPWSYVFSGLFLPPAPWPVAFAWFLALHVPALCAIAWMGWEAGARLKPADRRLGQFTAAAALITGSIPVCLYHGNYGVLGFGLVIGGFAADRAGRPICAGLFWGLAMIKPQVAILYGLVLLLRRSWLALVVGSVLVAAAWGAASSLIGKPAKLLLTEMIEQGKHHVGGVTGGFQGIQELLLYVGVPTGAMLAIGFGVGAIVVAWLGRWPRSAALAAVLIVPGVVIPLFVHHRTHDLMIQSPVIVLLSVHLLWSVQKRSVGAAVLAAGLLILLIVPIPYRVTRVAPMAHVLWRLAAVVGLWRVWPLVRAIAMPAPEGSTCPTP